MGAHNAPSLVGALCPLSILYPHNLPILGAPLSNCGGFWCLNTNIAQISFLGAVTGRKSVVTVTGVPRGGGAAVVSVKGGVIVTTMTGMGEGDHGPMTVTEIGIEIGVTGGVTEIAAGAGAFRI